MAARAVASFSASDFRRYAQVKAFAEFLLSLNPKKKPPHKERLMDYLTYFYAPDEGEKNLAKTAQAFWTSLELVAGIHLSALWSNANTQYAWEGKEDYHKGCLDASLKDLGMLKTHCDALGITIYQSPTPIGALFRTSNNQKKYVM